MMQSILFILVTGLAFFFAFKSVKQIIKNIKLGKDEDLSDQPNIRLKTMLKVAFGQSKMTTRPVAALFHFIIYVGFILINIEVLEIIIDGITGSHRIFMPLLGGFYGFLIGFFEILGFLVILACFVFLYRRNIQKIKRFAGVEMNGWPLKDANYILLIEIVLMSALLIMNAADSDFQNKYSMPISSWLAPMFYGLSETTSHTIVNIAWWFHWIGILLFINYIPFSKHLHIFMAFPNTYYSKLDAVGKINNMESVTTEVKLMLDPSFTPPENYVSPEGFGVKDVTDLSWKNLMEAYSCTECGRCTSVCPANITGKLLSPRKVMMDTRDRLVELGNEKLKNGDDFHDGKSLHDKISSEELWACTTCNACVDICPINIRPVDIIMQMRQYLTMEQSAAPSELNGMMTNLENNSAPWQFSPTDRANWTQ
ncbi:MAG: (Fe-S)-binding protein [Bacteroidota bacterium]|nr:(Fe-S)-binding protein [Bacteroidota bacterium]